MLIFAILPLPLVLRDRTLGRISGGVLAVGYVAFTVLLVARSLP